MAAALKLESVNFTMRNLSEELDVSFAELMERRKTDEKYDYLLDEKLIELCRKDGVVFGSRLAIWLCENPDLRVWLGASLEERTRRIAKRENKSFEVALSETKRRDAGDISQYEKLYGIDVLKHDFADLKINSEGMSVSEVAKKIVETAKRMAKEKQKPIPLPFPKKISETIEKKLKSNC